MEPNITRTIVQRLDPEGNVVGETITTVEEWNVQPPAPTESFGLYL